jgi:CheY-like chemotaxis protein
MDFPASFNVVWTGCCDPERVALRCLIVDDNAEFLRVAREVLQREGLTVVGLASTSAEAIQQAADLRPDVALVDVYLAQESGFDVARKLVEDGGGGGALCPTVILISTYAEGDLADVIAASPAMGFLSKADLSGKAVRAALGLRAEGPSGAGLDGDSPRPNGGE